MNTNHNHDDQQTSDCLDCIDGMAIAHTEFLGACFRVCATCQPRCQCCTGRGRFPAWTRDMAEFIASLNRNGLQPVLCHTCGGFLAAALLDADTTPSAGSDSPF